MRQTGDESDGYEVGEDPDEDMAVMYEAAEADLEAARAELADVRAYATRLEAALVRAHACPTVRDDGECDGCYVSETLATWPSVSAGQEGAKRREGKEPESESATAAPPEETGSE